MTDWTDARIDLLKTSWADGLSASQCAAELGGVTRNAVLGKVHRLKLPVRTSRPRKPRRQRQQKRLMFRNVKRLPEPIPTSIEPLNIPLVELKWWHCRETTGRGDDGLVTFCGHKKSRGSFCAYHGSINYESNRREGPLVKQLRARNLHRQAA